MEVIRDFLSLEDFSCLPPKSVLTIGNFDGVHLGHQTLLQETVAQAKKQEASSLVFTFKPHPQRILYPNQPHQLLSSYEERAQWIEKQGIDFLIEEPFDLVFSQIEAFVFFREFLWKRLHIKTIVVGHDFSFGRQRQGHLDALAGFCLGLGVELKVVPPYSVQIGSQKETVSSTKIRNLLSQGEVYLASFFLGRFFSYQGVVVHGDGRGAKLGFPTANFPLPLFLPKSLEGRLVLPYGVYITQTQVRGKSYFSVTYIGMRPTLEHEHNGCAWIETHLLEEEIPFKIDLYGQEIEVFFLERIRDEKKFSTVEALKKQILLDVQKSKEFHCLRKKSKLK